MKNNFDCRYASVGGTFCFHYDSEIGLNGTECPNCEMNNVCNYCSWEKTHKHHCKDCENKEESSC